MIKSLTVGVAAIVMVSAAAQASSLTRAELRRAPEGCEAVNPGQPTCSFKVTETMEGPVAGAAGTGSWVVKIKRGKKKITIQNPSTYGEPAGVTYLFKRGDRVTAIALSPGSGLVAGGD